MYIILAKSGYIFGYLRSKVQRSNFKHYNIIIYTIVLILQLYAHVYWLSNDILSVSLALLIAELQALL